jgi:uncharacterized membrane protein
MVFRAAALVALLSGTTALGLQLLSDQLSVPGYFWQNQVAFEFRLRLVKGVFAAACLSGVGMVGLAVVFGQRFVELPQLLWRLGQALSPIAPLSVVPILLRWQLWKDNELIYLTLVIGVALASKVAITAAIQAHPLELLGLTNSGETSLWLRFRSVVEGAPRWLWMLLVIIGVLAYTAYFSYYTVVWHRSCHSGWDLSIEDNILWNTLHGGHFFKAAPALGPTGSHFARHSALIAYLLVPFYALHPSSEMVLILQTVWMATPAIPLFLLGRSRVGAPLAALIALLYLMHPAVQESNLFEMHYVKLGTLPFWTTLWLLETRRYRWALLGAALTLMVREDVATWIVVLGVFAIAAGIQLRTSLALLIGGLCYVAVVKFVVMPSFVHGSDVLIFMYQDLLPTGKGTFAWAMATALTNPAYLMHTLLTSEKLIYFLHILTPIVFIPLRRPIGWFALIPGIIFSFLSTRYSALTDIHFQYSPHLLAMLYPALIMVLGAEISSARPDPMLGLAGAPGGSVSGGAPPARLVGSIAAMVVATLLCSSQFGAVIQQNTSREGPIPYHFGWNEEGHKRRQALDELLEMMPEDAKVAASAFTVTQVSSRSDAYSLSISLYDADYIVAATNRGELVPDEYTRLQQVFNSGEFGVVAVRPPFFLMRRGHSTAGNAQLRSLIR